MTSEDVANESAKTSCINLTINEVTHFWLLHTVRTRPAHFLLDNSANSFFLRVTHKVKKNCI